MTMQILAGGFRPTNLPIRVLFDTMTRYLEQVFLSNGISFWHRGPRPHVTETRASVRLAWHCVEVVPVVRWPNNASNPSLTTKRVRFHKPSYEVWGVPVNSADLSAARLQKQTHFCALRGRRSDWVLATFLVIFVPIRRRFDQSPNLDFATTTFLSLCGRPIGLTARLAPSSSVCPPVCLGRSGSSLDKKPSCR